MAATVAAPQRNTSESGLRVPDWALAVPERVWIGGFVVVLVIASAYLRTRNIGGQFWMDEALAVGISSHPLAAIPGVLRHDGSPPLYYLLLHIWMTIFGNQRGRHALAVAAVRAADDPGRHVGGLEPAGPARRDRSPRSLFAFNAFITTYSQETRMYSLMALLGLLATRASCRLRLPPPSLP